MTLEFCSISSGSKGNCYLIKADDTAILVDAGISGKKIFEGLKKVGLEPEDIDAVLVTHEHGDHVKGIRMVCKKSDYARIYANAATWESYITGSHGDIKYDDRWEEFKTGSSFAIGKLHIQSFSIHHDAVDPVGYSITYNNRKISIVTDTGHISENIYEEIKDANLLVLESNHEVNVLKVCSYPYATKMRILGDFGHLSNVAAAECLRDIMNEPFDECKTVLLAHLSQENNTPNMAKLAMRNILEENGLLSPERLNLEVLSQNVQSDIYIV